MQANAFVGFIISWILSACDARIDKSVTSLISNTARTFSGSCSKNNVRKTESLQWPPARFLMRCRIVDGLSSPLSYPRMSLRNFDSVVSSKEFMILSLIAWYLLIFGGLAIISDTKGNDVLYRLGITYLNFVSSLEILDKLNADSTCANHNFGFSFQNGGSFASVATPTTVDGM